MNPQTGNSERHENNTKSRVGNGRASQAGQSEDRSFLGCLPEEWLLLTLGWPSHGTRISRCAVTLEIWLLRWTLYRVLPQMNVGYMGSSTMIPCYHPWQCWETQSTSGLCRHPVRSTWAHHGRCWQAPSWWKRTVLKGTTDSFFSALALIFFTQLPCIGYNTHGVQTDETRPTQLWILLYLEPDTCVWGTFLLWTRLKTEHQKEQTLAAVLGSSDY